MGRAFLRSEAMKAVGHMEHNGVPLDVSTLAAFRAHWSGIRDDLIAACRPALRRLPQRRVPARSLRPIPGPSRDSMAANGDRPAQDRRRHVQGSGPRLARVVPAARAPAQSWRDAPLRPRGRRRWSQSDDAVAVPSSHRTEPAVEQQVHLRAEHVAAEPDPAGTRASARLCRLVGARGRRRRRVVG